MTKEELYELLDIESAEDFKYMENAAQYFEYEDEIEAGHLAELVEALDKGEAAGVIDDYFEDIMNGVPEAESEIYGLLLNIRRSLTGMVRHYDEVSTSQQVVDELERFRRWYSTDSKVYLTGTSDGREHSESLRDALFSKRMEALGGEKYFYDFSEALDYPLEEYVMSFGDMIKAAEEIEIGGEDEEF